MRANLILLVTLLLLPPAAADDKTDRERRVRVALALAGTDTPTAKSPDRASCGTCRLSLPAAKKEAQADGNKPVVLFVGQCGGLGDDAEEAGAVPVKVSEYVGDDRPAAERRVVVLEPKADKTGYWISATLPAEASRADVTAAVRKATPKAPAKLDWRF